MPNICDYVMKIISTDEKNVQKMLEILQRDYHGKTTDPLHMWRIFDADANGAITTVNKHGLKFYELKVSGTCAWSIYTCMMDGDHTYYNDHKHDKNNKGRTINFFCRQTKSDVEIWSEEYGCGFQEHYIIDHDGNMVVDECEEASEEYDEDEDEYRVHGGFKNWGRFEL